MTYNKVPCFATLVKAVKQQACYTKNYCKMVTLVRLRVHPLFRKLLPSSTHFRLNLVDMEEYAIVSKLSNFIRKVFYCSNDTYDFALTKFIDWIIVKNQHQQDGTDKTEEDIKSILDKVAKLEHLPKKISSNREVLNRFEDKLDKIQATLDILLQDQEPNELEVTQKHLSERQRPSPSCHGSRRSPLGPIRTSDDTKFV